MMKKGYSIQYMHMYMLPSIGNSLATRVLSVYHQKFKKTELTNIPADTAVIITIIATTITTIVTTVVATIVAAISSTTIIDAIVTAISSATVIDLATGV